MLPAVRTDQEWQAVVWDEQVIRPTAEDIWARPTGPASRRPARNRRAAPARGRTPAGVAQPDRAVPGIGAADARAPAALLHTEVTRENLMVSPGTRALSGLLDFETAMTGDRPASSPQSASSSRTATRACSAASWPLTDTASTCGSYSPTHSCTSKATCPNPSADSRPRPSPRSTPWPRLPGMDLVQHHLDLRPAHLASCDAPEIRSQPRCRLICATSSLPSSVRPVAPPSSAAPASLTGHS